MPALFRATVPAVAVSLLLLGTQAPAALAAPLEIVADQSGDSGPGTLADAVRQANESPGADTIIVRGEIAAAETIEVTDSVTLVGESGGHVVYTGRDPLLNAGVSPATISARDIRFTGSGRAAWEPMVLVGETDSAVPTVIDNVVVTQACEGFLEIDEATSAVSVSSSDFSDSSTADEAGEGSIIEVWTMSASFSLTDSSFHDDVIGAVAIHEANFGDDEMAEVRGNIFRDLAVEEAETNGVAFSIEGGDNRSQESPYLVMSGNTFENTRGYETGAVYAAGEGTVVIEGDSYTGARVLGDSGASASMLWLDAVHGAISIDGLTIADNDFGGLSVQEFHPSASGQALLQNSTIVRNGSAEAVASGDGAYSGGVSLTGDREDPSDRPVFVVRDTTIADNLGDEAGGLLLEVPTSAGSVTDETFALIERSTLANNEGNSGNQLVVSNWAFNEQSVGNPIQLRNVTVEQRGLASAGQALPAAIWLEEDATPLDLDHVTIAAGGIHYDTAETGGALTLRNTVLASEEVSAVSAGVGALLVNETNTAAVVPGPLLTSTAVPLAEMKLGALSGRAALDGATATIPLESGSALIDAGIAGDLATDQRDRPRNVGSAPDIGAVEVDGGVLTIVPEATAVAGSPLTFSVSRSGGSEVATSVELQLTDGTARLGVDFSDPGATLTWAEGETGAKTVSVPTMTRTADAIRTMQAVLGAPAPGSALGEPSTATGTITWKTTGGGGSEDPPPTPGEVVPETPDSLVDTGSASGPWWPGLLGAALLTLGAVLMRRRKHSA